MSNFEKIIINSSKNISGFSIKQGTPIYVNKKYNTNRLIGDLGRTDSLRIFEYFLKSCKKEMGKSWRLDPETENSLYADFLKMPEDYVYDYIDYWLYGNI